MTVVLRKLYQCHLQQFSSIFARKILFTPSLFNVQFIKMSVQDSKLTFQGSEDRFNGILVDTKQENCAVNIFPEKLKASLKQWKNSNRRGIWFKIALEHSTLVPILAQNGFDFHHAKNGYVMMYKWLPKSSCGIPPFAHTMVAVGALVVNDKNQILVVKEKKFLASFWKFPGGTVEPGEHLIDAAKREVKEETNITFDFTSVISLMHADKGVFGCSDFYVLVAGRALTENIVKCDREIDDCMWIDMHEYLKRDDATAFNKTILQNYLTYQKNEVKIDYVEDVHNVSKREYSMYSIHFNKK